MHHTTNSIHTSKRQVKGGKRGRCGQAAARHPAKGRGGLWVIRSYRIIRRTAVFAATWLGLGSGLGLGFGFGLGFGLGLGFRFGVGLGVRVRVRG